MKDAKSLINALQRKNQSMASQLKNKSGKVNIKFKSVFGWMGWFGSGLPGLRKKFKK